MIAIELSTAFIAGIGFGVLIYVFVDDVISKREVRKVGIK